MKVNKIYKYFTPVILTGLVMVAFFSCTDRLEEPFEDETFTSDVDYTKGEDIILPVLGAYQSMYFRGWEEPLTLGIRGDDVNAAGDQVPMQEQDNFKYLASHWNLRTLWEQNYEDIITTFTAMDEVEKYRPAAGDDALADQYVAECRVIRAYAYLNIGRAFGKGIIIDELDNIQNLPASSKEEIMQYIIDEMDEVIPLLPDMHPNKRSDIKGGVTRYTAYALQAIAYQQIEDYQGVADATSAIISSGEYELSDDFYHLFKKAGKLDDENILEFQFSAFNSGTGPQSRHGFNPMGLAWNPVRTGAGGGWNFYEPTKKYIKFMLDRGETERLETTVHWTPSGMTEIENEWGALPEWIDHFNREGDEFLDNPRKKWGAGKWIQPSTELIEGRTLPGSNKNLIVIRYAEMLLMYAEALTRGASSSISMSADDAVNLVRNRAGMADLSGVTTEQVLDEKFAELATEWGIRFYDMVRTENVSELSHEGKTFTMDKAYYPIPANQVADLPQLGEEETE